MYRNRFRSCGQRRAARYSRPLRAPSPPGSGHTPASADPTPVKATARVPPAPRSRTHVGHGWGPPGAAAAATSADLRDNTRDRPVTAGAATACEREAAAGRAHSVPEARPATTPRPAAVVEPLPAAPGRARGWGETTAHREGGAGALPGRPAVPVRAPGAPRAAAPPLSHEARHRPPGPEPLPAASAPRRPGSKTNQNQNKPERFT